VLYWLLPLGLFRTREGVLLIGLHQSATGILTVKTSPPEDFDFQSKEISVPKLLSHIIKSSVREQKPRRVARNQLRIFHPRQKSARRVYDRPGKKPTAEYELDPLKLQTSCEQRGGTDFACQWIPIIFEDGVTLGALARRLKLTGIERMNFPDGFGPCLAYDGFLEKAGNGFESCLCTVGKRVWWKNKKDAVRHLRFGLADRCVTWLPPI